MKMKQIVRGSGLALLVVGALAGCQSPSPRQESSPLADAQPKGKAQTYYFFDWNDVENGRTVPIYDASRLTEEAKTNFAQMKKDWNISTRLGKHGTRQYHVPHGIRIAIEPGKKTARFITPDQPWEDEFSGGNVILDKGRFRCWYSATMPKQRAGLVFLEEGRGMETNGSSTCYAESTDGIHWTKPALGLLAFNGSRSNNMISAAWIDSPFLDEQGKPEERYKATTFDELPAEDVPKGAGPFLKYGLYGLVSPDGYKWTRLPKPLIKHFADTWNIGGWDPVLKKYVAYVRGHTGGRSITRAETDDFHNWPMPTTVFCLGPEERPSQDYYSSGYTTYPGVPSIRLMFPGIYHLYDSTIDSRLAISRDSYGWNWVSHDAIIPLGTEKEWDRGMVFGQPNLLKLPDGRLALPYNGYQHGHETDFSTAYRDWPKNESGMAWATWDDGRLAGIQADKVGDFYAASTASDISAIQINARGGRIEVELVEKDNVLPGFSFADGIPISGDHLWATVRWKGKEDYSELRGKKFQVHFRLTRAKIFAYRTIGNSGR
jgi:hypothetical protein